MYIYDISKKMIRFNGWKGDPRLTHKAPGLVEQQRRIHHGIYTLHIMYIQYYLHQIMRL